MQQCGSESGIVWQCDWRCAAVWAAVCGSSAAMCDRACGMQCAAVPGSAAVCCSVAVRGSAGRSVVQCARHRAAVCATSCVSARGNVRLFGCVWLYLCLIREGDNKGGGPRYKSPRGAAGRNRPPACHYIYVYLNLCHFITCRFIMFAWIWVELQLSPVTFYFIFNLITLLSVFNFVVLLLITLVN